MPRRTIPSYRLHKPSGQAVVTLSNRDHYLGEHGSAESREKYDRLVAEWLAAGRRFAVQPRKDTRVVELCVAYLRHAERHYRGATGEPSTQIHQVHAAIRGLRRLYGSTPVAEFGPRSLEALRSWWIAGKHRAEPGAALPVKGRRHHAPLSRKTINAYVSQVRQIFRWGVAQELVPADVHQALLTLPGLSAGRSDARETDARTPAPLDHVEPVKHHLSKQLAAVVELQLLTGARPSELLALRTIDIDTSGDVWTAKPVLHKTKHHGKGRTLYFGPKAQAVLRPLLKPAVHAHLFSPRDAMREHQAARAVKGKRRRPNQKPNPRKTSRRLGDHYTAGSYRQAVEAACEAAGVPTWTPYQLRHTAATELRKRFGLEVAAMYLGHSSAIVTEAVYARRDEDVLRRVAAEAS